MAGIVRLSRKFHETVGEDLAEELEAGFDQLDAMSRAAFRDLFDVRLDQRLGETKADLRQEINGLEVRLRQEISRLEVQLRQEISGLEVRLRQEIAELRVALAGAEGRLIRWMFLFWVGTIGISILQKL